MARKDEGGGPRTTSRRPSRKTLRRKTAQRRTPRTGHSGGRPKKKSHEDPAVAERAKGRKIPTSCTNSLFFSLLFRKFYFYFCKNHNLSPNPMNDNYFFNIYTRVSKVLHHLVPNGGTFCQHFDNTQHLKCMIWVK